MRLEVPGRNSGKLINVNSGGGSVKLEALNAMSFIESCNIFLHHPHNTEFSENVRITCEGHCYIYQNSDSLIKFRQNLDIVGERIDTNFLNIEVAQALNATATVGGNLKFHGITTGTTAHLNTTEGDALYQSTS